MKKLISSSFVIIIISLLNAANCQTLDDILSRHFKAVGQEKLVAAKSIYVKAKLSQMGMEMPMEMKIKKPDKFLVTLEMQGQKMIQVYNGEKGWMVAPWISPEPQELTGETLTQAKQQVNLEGELYNYKEKGSTAEFAGKVNLDGKEAYRIKLTSSGGDTKDYFIDPTNNMVSRIKASVSNQGQTVDVEQVMSEYKTFEGVTMATKIESKLPMGSVHILFEDIKFNENFEDSLFEKPAK